MDPILLALDVTYCVHELVSSTARSASFAPSPRGCTRERDTTTHLAWRKEIRPFAIRFSDGGGRRQGGCRELGIPYPVESPASSQLLRPRAEDPVLCVNDLSGDGAPGSAGCSRHCSAASSARQLSPGQATLVRPKDSGRPRRGEPRSGRSPLTPVNRCADSPAVRRCRHALEQVLVVLDILVAHVHQPRLR